MVTLVAPSVGAVVLAGSWSLRVPCAFVLIAASIVTFVLAQVRKAQHTKTYRGADRREEMAQAIEDLPQSMLRIAAHGALRTGNTERVSLYRHDPLKREFQLLTRYSKNPKWSLPGRDTFPDDKGAIGLAWAYGSCYVTDLPSPGNLVRYENALTQKGIPVPHDVLATLRMPSRSYAGYRLSYGHGDSIAVVILESESAVLPVSEQEFKDWAGGDFGGVLHTAVLGAAGPPGGGA